MARAKPATADVLPHQGALRAALADACDQLEGWVAWKCPRKHRAEHQAYIARLRALAAGQAEPDAPPELPLVADIEVLVWHAPEDPKRPDADMEVLVHLSDYGLVLASWDEDIAWWRDANGLAVNGGRLVGWAEPRGVN